jgi:hypothetical protein
MFMRKSGAQFYSIVHQASARRQTLNAGAEVPEGHPVKHP